MKMYGHVDCGSIVIPADECGGIVPCGDKDAVEVRLKLRPNGLYAEINCQGGPKEVLLWKWHYGLMFSKGRHVYIVRTRMDYSRDWYFGIPCNECCGVIMCRIDVLTGETSNAVSLKCDKPVWKQAR